VNPPAGLDIGSEQRHEPYMRLALALAARAAREGEVPVGCVVVRGEDVIGRGYNRREGSQNALDHAELIAIGEACRATGYWRLTGCRLYVTLEPCPMCAGAAVNARLDTVIFGAADPKAGALGSVFNLFGYPLNHRPEVVPGILAEACAAPLTAFFKTLRG